MGSVAARVARSANEAMRWAMAGSCCVVVVGRYCLLKSVDDREPRRQTRRSLLYPPSHPYRSNSTDRRIFTSARPWSQRCVCAAGDCPYTLPTMSSLNVLPRSRSRSWYTAARRRPNTRPSKKPEKARRARNPRTQHSAVYRHVLLPTPIPQYG